MLIVVTGPPAAGKSSYIKARAKANDIVIDLDLMALAMAGPGADHHKHSETLLRIVHRARQAAIHEAERHLDTTDVYLIHTQPSPKARARYKRLGARIVVVDPGEQVVRQRVRDMRQGEMEGVVTRWYRDHRKGGSRPVTAQASRLW
ncbi:ATP-binding protein [Streptomyces sp. A3M-1-3]|uniref:ATP-binding protein n=1 Tax=Streptomyces sp. A3M-1-3 TaxID=2962044 RepID=UPI0020B7972F|nr:ATP-binding protein [Streptomyces sp. A3M-1-3]MCP3820077.1 ATP-binding protein [Streptomyces sp. A3M-1-3]